MHSKGNRFKIGEICFKITYLITNESIFFKYQTKNIFLIKIVANASLTTEYERMKTHINWFIADVSSFRLYNRQSSMQCFIAFKSEVTMQVKCDKVKTILHKLPVISRIHVFVLCPHIIWRD